MGKVSWRFKIDPKRRVRTRCKPASGFSVLDRILKWSQALRSFRGGERMRRQGPRIGKVSWRFKIGPKRLVRTRCKPASGV